MNSLITYAIPFGVVLVISILKIKAGIEYRKEVKENPARAWQRVLKGGY